MSAPLTASGLAALIGVTWTVIAAVIVIHRSLNRRWPVRQAEHLTRTAAQDRP